MAEVGRNDSGHVLWRCRCECGNAVEVAGKCLYNDVRRGRQGNTKSCGCLDADLKLKHGMDGTPEYRAYVDAKARCTNPNHKNYASYGGRGIRFLFDSFEQFYAEIGPRPEAKHPNGYTVYSVDRKNNNGNYEPGNIHWATQEQSLNRRSHEEIFAVAA